MLFDVLCNNADRKGSHVFFEKDTHQLYAIDHGICFHEEDKLRTVLWDFSGQKISEELLASLSAGRRAVPIDDRELASRLTLSRDSVATALAILEERGAFAEICRPPVVRLRLLASPLRIECERASLSGSARTLLAQVIGLPPGTGDWRSVVVSGTGLSSHQLTEAVGELESGQLVYVDPAPSRAVVAADSRSRAHVERLIRQRRARREVERAKLNSMVGYATTLMCRRRFILNYFGDQTKGEHRCGDCDVCARS